MTMHEQASRTEINRATVLELYRRLGSGDLGGAFALLHDDFITHNPQVPHDPAVTSGKQAFREFFGMPAGQALAAATQEVQRLIADGDLVTVHLRMITGGAEVAIVDILRLRDGLIAEHWDVVQPVPDPIPHPHGMF